MEKLTMADREKLIELLKEANHYEFEEQKKKGDFSVEVGWKLIADHLIANGVTIQKWIPVTERLPEDGARVLVYHDDGRIRFGINEGGFADVVSRTYLSCHHHKLFSKATHWMYLPEAPKGE